MNINEFRARAQAAKEAALKKVSPLLEEIQAKEALLEEMKEVIAIVKGAEAKSSALDKKLEDAEILLKGESEGEPYQPQTVEDAFQSLGLEKVEIEEEDEEIQKVVKDLINPPPPQNGGNAWHPMPEENDVEVIMPINGGWFLLIEIEEGKYPSSIEEAIEAINNDWVAPVPIQFWNGMDIGLEPDGATHYRKAQKKG
jgi:hypothetical protein